jgi:hypothetical protein
MVRGLSKSMEGYDDFLRELKERILDAQTRAMVPIYS